MWKKKLQSTISKMSDPAVDFIHDDNSSGLIILHRLIQVKTPFWRTALTRPNCCTCETTSCSPNDALLLHSTTSDTSHHAKVSILCSGACPTGWKKNFKTSYFGLNIWTFALKQININMLAFSSYEKKKVHLLGGTHLKISTKMADSSGFLLAVRTPIQQMAV
ncbi:uncharacterized protein LOC144066090 [Stigmatopora argus]